MNAIQAWHIYEILEDGTKRHLATIRTPDAEIRAHAKVDQILEEEGKVVYAEPFDGPFVKLN